MLNFIKLYRTPFLFGLLSIIFYASFAYDLERHDFPKLVALYGALFFFAYKLIQVARGNFWILAGFGIAFRFVFMGSIPNLSQDFYRFLWDGQLLLQGINPYLFTPAQLANGASSALDLISLDSIANSRELLSGMGALNASHFSNYPPVNQLFFAIAALFAKQSILGSVIVLRILLIAADIGILYFGRKLLKNLDLNPNAIFWYFLNPFILIEMTGNLHFESVMLFFVVWSLYLLQKRTWSLAAVLLGISVSVKLLPLLFLPLFLQWFLRKKNATAVSFSNLLLFYLITIGTVVATFLPFLSTAFIQNFSATISLWFQNFEFNASVYYLIRWIGFQTVGWNIIATVGAILPIVVVLFVLGLTFFRKNATTRQLMTAMLFGVSFYLLLSTTIHPWYVATPLILCVFTRYRFPVVWSGVVVLSYSAYGAEGFSENLWLVALEYFIVVGYAVWEFLKLKRESPELQEG